MKNNELTLGLDLGITSVGFGVVDKDLNIIKYGVRLFDENTADENIKRRDFRHLRRSTSRKTNRLNALKYLLVREGIIDDFNYEKLSNVYDLRIKGLHNKLNNIELANVLVNLFKHRGVDFELVTDGKVSEEDKSLKDSISYNTQVLKERNIFVCQLQKERLQQGKLRNTNNVFKTEDFVKELEQILANQELKEEIINKIIEIFTRKRHFSEGPGSAKFPTDFGSYRFIDGKVTKVNLIDVMRGKCSIYKDEPRIAKASLSALIFNFLNDLNNLTIKGREDSKVTVEEKNQIFKYIFDKGNITIKRLCIILKSNEDKISGFRINKDENNIITDFKPFAQIKKIYNIKDLNYQIYIDNVDKIVDILTMNKTIEDRLKELEASNVFLSNDEKNELVKLTGYNQYHSLSKKAIDELIPELYATNKNQMQIISLSSNRLERNNRFNIEFNDELILSPVVKRVHREAIKVINELRKDYGEFESIVIETTRSKNSKEEKNFINQLQKSNEEAKKIVESKLLEMEKNPEKYNAKTKLKLRLALEQDLKTAYSGNPINIEALLDDNKAYEIEHIIPFAISSDNSLNNLVLASVKENQDKGKRSPYSYFKSGKVAECDGPVTNWEEFKVYVNSFKGFSKRKKEHLLDERDINSIESNIDFVNRNLNDTSYAIRSVMETLNNHFKASNINTTIFTVKGKITNAFRQVCHLHKDRDEYKHHAIDALIIAASAKRGIFNRTINKYYIENGNIIDKETGEVRELGDPLCDPIMNRFVSSLNNLKFEWYNFSYKIDSKPNRALFDQTTYSTRKCVDESGNEVEKLVKTYKDIYGDNGKELAKLFKKGKSECLLMYKNDIQTYNLLKDIVLQYKDTTNPFLAYKEEFGPIRKYSKKGNGSIITNVKYYSGILKLHKDISNKYNVDTTKKRVVKMTLNPYRIDVYSNGKTFKIVLIKHIDLPTLKNDYEKLKKEHGVDDKYQYLFTLYKNNIIYIDNGVISGYFKYRGATGNRIEVKYIEKNTPKDMRNKLRITISQKVTSFYKINVSPTGKYKKIEKEALKLKY